MKTQQQSKCNSNQRCKQTFLEWLFSLFGWKKSRSQEDSEMADDGMSQDMCSDGLIIPGANLLLEGKRNEFSDILQPGQQEDYSSLVGFLRQNGVLRNDEDWKNVDLSERLQLYVVSKCILCWNRMYPDEVVNQKIDTLDVFMNLLHSGFIGIGNRERINDWFQEIAMELNWNIQSMEWLQNPKKYLAESRMNMKRQYEQLDKRVEKVIRKLLDEWEDRQNESITGALQLQVDKLESEKAPLLAEVTRIKGENALLSENLNKAVKDIQRLEREKNEKMQALSNSDDKLQSLAGELEQKRKELERLQSQNEQLTATSSEYAEMMDQHYKMNKQWSRDFFVKLDEIGLRLDEWVRKVVDSNPDTSIYRNLLNRVSISYGMMKDEISNLKNLSDWEEGKIEINEMINRIQPFLQESMKRNGWINILAYLNCYCYIPQVAVEFKNHDLDILKLGRLYVMVTALLGEVQIAIFVPRLLVDQFTEDYYEFKNSDIWINKFCPEISPRDYAGKVFDLVQIGYSIQGKEQVHNKPIVVYY
jgi:hypothetical protein